MIKKRIAVAAVILAAVLTISGSVVCYADEIDLSGMGTQELETLKDSIDEELAANHKPSLKQKNGIEKATKQFLEEKYGKENVNWSKIGKKHTKEWDFYTLHGSVKILREDGGEAKYDVYSEAVNDNKEYTLVYVRLGNEEVLNDRTLIHDERVQRLVETGLAEEAEGTEETEE